MIGDRQRQHAKPPRPSFRNELQRLAAYLRQIGYRDVKSRRDCRGQPAVREVSTTHGGFPESAVSALDARESLRVQMLGQDGQEPAVAREYGHAAQSMERTREGDIFGPHILPFYFTQGERYCVLRTPYCA